MKMSTLFRRSLPVALWSAAVLVLSGCNFAVNEDEQGGWNVTGEDGTPIANISSRSSANEQNLPPSVVPGSVSVDTDEAVKEIDVNEFASDPEGEVLTIQSASANSGQVFIGSDGKLIYSASRDGSDNQDLIKFVVSDGVHSTQGALFLRIGEGSSAPDEQSVFDIDVSWEAPEKRMDGQALDASSDIVKYVVAYKREDWDAFQRMEVAGSVTQVTIPDLVAGLYEIKISAVDFWGEASEYSEVLMASVGM